MGTAPRAEQLDIPEQYGSPTTLLEWETVEQRLADAKQYWLATVRPDGRPHVVPLDGQWRNGRWYFGGVPTTVKHANLLAEPRVTMHLEDGTSAVIVEGRCEITLPSDDEAEALASEQKQKYGYGVPAEVYRQGVWTLIPAKVMAWTELATDATRFRF